MGCAGFSRESRSPFQNSIGRPRRSGRISMQSKTSTPERNDMKTKRDTPQKRAARPAPLPVKDGAPPKLRTPQPKPRPTPTVVVLPNPEPAPILPEPAPIRNVVKIGLPGYLCAKFQMLQHLGGKIDSLAAVVPPEQVQRYDLVIT